MDNSNTADRRATSADTAVLPLPGSDFLTTAWGQSPRRLPKYTYDRLRVVAMRAVQISSFPPPPLCNMCNVQARQWFPFLKPQGEYRCQPCRRIEPQTSWPSHVCGTCGVVFKRKCLARDMDKPKFCSIACNNRRPSRLVHGTERIKRAERLATAPGLTYAQVKALRAMWKRQGRRCTYCGWRAGNTIDHVVPLARGGSNYEGNLAPACKSCNSSKSGRLLIEWKQRPSKEA